MFWAEVVRQVGSAQDWGGVRVAMVTCDVTAEGVQFTCRCLSERTGCAWVCACVWERRKESCLWGQETEQVMEIKELWTWGFKRKINFYYSHVFAQKGIHVRRSVRSEAAQVRHGKYVWLFQEASACAAIQCPAVCWWCYLAAATRSEKFSRSGAVKEPQTSKRAQLGAKFHHEKKEWKQPLLVDSARG